MFRINYGRIQCISAILKKVFTDDIISKMVLSDPQYKALEHIYIETESPWITVLSTVTNSLVSYQLSGRGEDYWIEFSKRITASRIDSIESLRNFFKEFLLSSRYNRLYVRTKIRRVEKFLDSRLAIELYRTPCRYSRDLYRLLESTAKTMDQDLFDKTIVFSTKMYHYASMIVCREYSVDYRVPIPVDKRVTTASLLSGVIEYTGSNRDLLLIVNKLMSRRYRRLVIDAWMNVSSISGIPCIYLDTILWLLTGCYTRSRTLSSTIECVCSGLGVDIETSLLEKAISHLFYNRII